MKIESLEKLTKKGNKSNLQFPTSVRERLIRECGFTDEETIVLNLRARGRSIAEISLELNCSVETVNRRIRSIKNKIAELVQINGIL